MTDRDNIISEDNKLIIPLDQQYDNKFWFIIHNKGYKYKNMNNFVDLNKNNKLLLMELAKLLNVRGRTGMKKKKLVEILENKIIFIKSEL